MLSVCAAAHHLHAGRMSAYCWVLLAVTQLRIVIWIMWLLLLLLMGLILLVLSGHRLLLLHAHLMHHVHVGSAAAAAAQHFAGHAPRTTDTDADTAADADADADAARVRLLLRVLASQLAAGAVQRLVLLLGGAVGAFDFRPLVVRIVMMLVLVVQQRVGML